MVQMFSLLLMLSAVFARHGALEQTEFLLL
jgi:hypothetical protein